VRDAEDPRLQGRLRIIQARPHFDSLAARLREPRVQRVIEPLIAGAGLPPVNADYDDDVSYVHDLLVRKPYMAGSTPATQKEAVELKVRRADADVTRMIDFISGLIPASAANSSEFLCVHS